MACNNANLKPAHGPFLAIMQGECQRVAGKSRFFICGGFIEKIPISAYVHRAAGISRNIFYLVKKKQNLCFNFLFYFGNVSILLSIKSAHSSTILQPGLSSFLPFNETPLNLEKSIFFMIWFFGSSISTNIDTWGF